MIRFFGGVVATLILIAGIGFLCVQFGWLPARADDKPSRLERQLASKSLDATIAREMPHEPYPIVLDNTAAFEGVKLYRANCAVCHGTGAGDASALATGMYIRSPQLGKHGVDDDPAGMNYWKVEHGIRFTGMPAYVGTLSETQIWQIVAFLQIPNDKLPPNIAKLWNEPPTVMQ